MFRTRRPPAPRSGLKAGLLLCLGIVGLTAAAPACRSQVLEIDAVGGITRHDGPSVITSDGERAILPPVRAPAARSRREPIVDRIGFEQAGKDADLSPDLLAAVAWRESSFRNNAASRAGAVGQMQLMPGTARDLGINPSDPRQNLRGGAAYLKLLLNRYHGDLELALAAYNAGPARVDRRHAVPPIAETQAYVGAILARLSDVAEGRALSLEARAGTK